MEQKTNSNNTEQRRAEKVVRGTAVTKKKSEIRKLADIFISEDVNSVTEYIFLDVIVPALKKAFTDAVKISVDMIVYGESERRKSSTSASKVSYRSYYDDRRERTPVTRSRSQFEYDNILYPTRGDAESVLYAMEDSIEEYGMVSVGALYDFSDISTSNYMVNKYGWTNLRGAEIVRVRDGYMIKLPKPIPLH